MALTRIQTNALQSAITSGNIADGTIVAADLASGAVTAPKLAAGAVENYMATNGVTYMFRNKIINGNFDVWQRGTSMSVTAAGGQRITDRFAFSTGANPGAATVSRQEVTSSDTAILDKSRYYYRHQQTVGNASNGRLNYFVEDVRTLSNRTVTLSFYAKANKAITGSIGSLDAYMQQYFGSGGFPSNAVSTDAKVFGSLTTSWQRFTVSFDLPSISGKTLGTNNDSYLFFEIRMPPSDTYTIDFAQFQLEEGSVATPFEVRPFATELALCQRYYEKSFQYSVAPANGATSTSFVDYAGAASGVATNVLGLGAVVHFKVSKRTIPSITKYGNVNGDWLYAALTATSWTAGANGGTAFLSENSFAINQQIVNGTALFVLGHWVANAEYV